MLFAGQHMRELALSVAVGGNIHVGGGQHAKGNGFNGTSLWFSNSMSMGKKYLEKHTRMFSTEFLIILKNANSWTVINKLGIKYEQIKCIVNNKDIFLYLWSGKTFNILFEKRKSKWVLCNINLGRRDIYIERERERERARNNSERTFQNVNDFPWKQTYSPILFLPCLQSLQCSCIVWYFKTYKVILKKIHIIFI